MPKDIEVTASPLSLPYYSPCSHSSLPILFLHHQSGSYNLDTGPGLVVRVKSTQTMWGEVRGGLKWDVQEYTELAAGPRSLALFSLSVQCLCSLHRPISSCLHTWRQLAEEVHLVNHSKTGVKKKTGKISKKI